MRIPKVKDSDRIALQILATLGIAGMASRSKHKLPWILLAPLVAFIGSGVNIEKENNTVHFDIDATYSHKNNVL